MSQSGHYHCQIKAVGRATGRSAVAAAAYRAAEVLHDERTGLTHHYGERSGVVESFIVLPANAPTWASDREKLWNAVEARTTAKNGRLATELEIGLPHELTAAQRRELIGNFARSLSDRYNVAIDVAIHGPGKGGDNRNHHAHVMISHRELGPDGFGEICNARLIERKVKGQMKPVEIAGFTASGDVVMLKQHWEKMANAAYEAAGLDVRIDHRSHKDRGLLAEPTKHLGPSASSMERRGEATDRGDINRAVAARNTRLEQIEAQRMSLTAAIAELAAERQARADQRELRAAVRTDSAARILEALTEKRATFTRVELVRTLGRAVESKDEAQALATELLAHPDIIGLRENATANVSRYTTRTVLAEERAVLREAQAMAEYGGHGLSDRQRNAVLVNHKHLDEEQRAAFEHLTGKGSFKVLAGEAGTGKSTTLAAVRDAYEKAGYRVIGMAWTNSVIQDMAADGFREVATVSAALGRIERAKADSAYHTKRNGVAVKNRPDRDAWNRKTVIIVDEAAMLSTHSLAKLTGYGAETGAKIIGVGDDMQLASIERGGLFGALKARLGAAELHNVWRVQDLAQKRAYNAMHAGRFGEAMEIFDRAGAIKWTDTQGEARAALVSQWAADTKATPEKNRFVFAYSNADVQALNGDLRAIRRERGELGQDHVLQTKDGPAAFAAGDRIQFTGSAYYREDKNKGLVTGAIGTVKEIDGRRITVELDGKDKSKGRVVSFTVGAEEGAGEFDAIRHGYAGTIYKAQGRTLDESYLYHSQSWRAATAYVGLSRHRERTSLYVAREVTRGREPWMMQQGGLDALDEQQRQRADNAYQAWAEENPAAAEKYGLARYVAYVQDKQAERGRSEYDMAQLVRQISRADETRAASQFFTGEIPPTKATGGGGGARPRLSGPNRYAALKAKAKAMLRPITDPLADLMRRTGRKPGRDAQAYADLTKQTQAAAAKARTDDLLPPDIKAEVDAKARAEEKKYGRKRGPGLDL
jgi:Ti-type conjugative transfer relaxase TraA